MQLSRIFSTGINSYLPLPLYQCKVQAGFPSPADDHIETKIDLNKQLVSSPTSTFFVRVSGHSMIDSGIKDGDLLVVDRSLEARHNKIVVAVIRGEFTVKRLKITIDGAFLVAENKAYPPIKLDENSYIWGVVKSVIHEF